MFVVGSYLHLLCSLKKLYPVLLNRNRSIQIIEETLSGTITPGHSGSVNNNNKEVHDTPLIPRTGDSPMDAFYCHVQGTAFFFFFFKEEGSYDVLYLS